MLIVNIKLTIHTIKMIFITTKLLALMMRLICVITTMLQLINIKTDHSHYNTKKYYRTHITNNKLRIHTTNRNIIRITIHNIYIYIYMKRLIIRNEIIVLAIE